MEQEIRTWLFEAVNRANAHDNAYRRFAVDRHLGEETNVTGTCIVRIAAPDLNDPTDGFHAKSLLEPFAEPDLRKTAFEV